MLPITPRLARALQRALGEDATGDFLALLETRDALHAELRADVAELRQEMRVGFARVDSRFEQARADVAGLRTEMERMRGDLIDRIGKRFAHLLMWSFGFWLTSVVTIGWMLKNLR